MKPPVTDHDPFTSRDPREITDVGDLLGSMTDEARGYVASERAYLTLLLAKRTSEMAGSLIGALVGTVIIAAVMVFGSVAAAIALGRALGDPALGYLIISGVYAVLFIVFLFAMARTPWRALQTEPHQSPPWSLIPPSGAWTRWSSACACCNSSATSTPRA
jgi:hypothetical protein